MQGLSGGLKAYWKRQAYHQMDPAERPTGRRRRRLARAELGDGRRRWFWRIRGRIRFRFRSLRKGSPRRILAWIRDAYVRLMLAFANSAAVAGYGGAVVGFRPSAAKEYDEMVLVQIYKQIVAQGGIATVGPVANGQIVASR